MLVKKFTLIYSRECVIQYAIHKNRIIFYIARFVNLKYIQKDVTHSLGLALDRQAFIIATRQGRRLSCSAPQITKFAEYVCEEGTEQIQMTMILYMITKI